jgi:hypothetical protein
MLCGLIGPPPDETVTGPSPVPQDLLAESAAESFACDNVTPIRHGDARPQPTTQAPGG